MEGDNKIKEIRLTKLCLQRQTKSNPEMKKQKLWALAKFILKIILTFYV